MNGGFCKYCSLWESIEWAVTWYLSVASLTNLHKVTEILRGHFFGKDGRGKLSYTLAVADSMTFVQYMEQELQSIDVQLNAAVAKHRELSLKSILKTVILCGRQNLPLRRHRDDSSSTSANKGNFITLLKFQRAEAGDAVLAKHFETASSRSTYTSKTVQNEFISACGSYISEKKFGIFQSLQMKQQMLLTVSSCLLCYDLLMLI